MQVSSTNPVDGHWSFKHWKLPVFTLVTVTLTLNVLALSIPIAATQVFDRIIPNPNSSTLTFLILGVVGFAALEMLLRLGRAYMLAQAGATYAWTMTYEVLRHIAVSDIDHNPIKSEGSLEYISAIQQTKEKFNGQVLVGMAELFFLPIMLCLIFYISPGASFLTLVGLVLFGVFTFFESRNLRDSINKSTIDNEDRYGFLFAMLNSIHSIKAMAIEDDILRRYEVLQERITRGNHRTATSIGRLLGSAPIANQLIMALMLTYGAFAVNRGTLTLGGVSALVLLGGRVMGPLQRAVFIFVQFKDVDRAQDSISSLFERPLTPRGLDEPDIVNEGRVVIDELVYRAPDASAPILDDVHLSILPGEIVTISGDSESDISTLLQLMAGIRVPTSGTVNLNGVSTLDYPQALLNRCAGYIPANGVMFRGNIRDNITRFGEVSVDEVMSVASVLEIDTLINELPKGLDTELLGGVAETVPPGLKQQLAILRAVATRPKLILLDQADRGLDRASYAKLHGFIGKVHGQASIVVASDDVNLVRLAGKHFRLKNAKLNHVGKVSAVERTAYKDLKL